jgi:hypothetical protein
MLTLTRASQTQPSVNAISEAAIEPAEKANSARHLGRSTLTQHMSRGLREAQPN